MLLKSGAIHSGFNALQLHTRFKLDQYFQLSEASLKA